MTTPNPATASSIRLPHAIDLNRKPNAAIPAESAEEVGKERPASSARGCDIDDRIPEAHEGKDDACRVGVRDGDGLGVDEGVDAVDGGRDPGDEQGDEE